MQISLDDVKEYLRIENDEEDVFLQRVLDYSISQCETMLNRPILQSNMTPETEWQVPKQVELAVLLLCSHWYENRSPLLSGENQKGKKMPYGLEAILGPYTFRQV